MILPQHTKTAPRRMGHENPVLGALQHPLARQLAATAIPKLLKMCRRLCWWEAAQQGTLRGWTEAHTCAERPYTVNQPDVQGSDCTGTLIAAADDIDTALLLPAARGQL